MAAITSADVTVSVQESWMSAPGRIRRRVKVTFPNGATNNQYQTGGVPLDLNKLGLRSAVQSLSVVGRSTGSGGGTNVDNPHYLWNGSQTAPKLLAYHIDAAGAAEESFLELDNNETAWAQDSQVLYLDVMGY